MPRLGLRFLLVVVAGLLAAGVCILVVVERTLADQAERQALDHARTIVADVLDRRLRPADVRSSVSPTRRRELQALVSTRTVGGDAIGATLYSAAGLIVVSSGEVRPPAAAVVARARAGTGMSTVTSDGSRTILRTLVPVRVGSRSAAVIELDQDYGRIASAARRTSLVVAGILEALLLALCVLLLPTLARASARLRRQLELLDHMASHDELTDLHNRAGFGRLLHRELEPGGLRGVVLLVDVERFHEINEALGGDRADELLVEVARRLRTALPDCSWARLGEDEFATFLPNCVRAGVVGVSATLAGALSRPVDVDGIRLQTEIRFGAAQYPEHGTDPDTLLRHAGIALAHAKSAVDRIAIYEETFERDDLSRLELVAALRDALRAGDITVYYQPQVSLRTGRVRAVEALVRWEHPERGVIPAGAFIEAVEQSAVSAELGRKVLAAVVEQWRRWYDDGLTVDVAVNVSAVDLLDTTLPAAIAELLLEHQMPADHLVVEITERTLVAQETTSRVLRELERLGVCLSVDDFGTGYSSLAVLQTLPISQVKIDRCFVAGIPEDVASDTIVGSTIGLAHALGATVVAEGIEREGQLRRLVLLGCDAVQGYLIGRPQPAEQISAALRRAAGARRAHVGQGAR